LFIEGVGEKKPPAVVNGMVSYLLNRRALVPWGISRGSQEGHRLKIIQFF